MKKLIRIRRNFLIIQINNAIDEIRNNHDRLDYFNLLIIISVITFFNLN